jgi:hypothetical protein
MRALQLQRPRGAGSAGVLAGGNPITAETKIQNPFAAEAQREAQFNTNRQIRQEKQDDSPQAQRKAKLSIRCAFDSISPGIRPRLCGPIDLDLIRFESVSLGALAGSFFNFELPLSAPLRFNFDLVSLCASAVKAFQWTS